MPIPESALYAIDGRASLLAFLRDQLGWPVDSDDTFMYVGPQLQGKAAIRAWITQIMPLTVSARFTTILVEFEAAFRRSDLRQILCLMREEICKRAGYGGRRLDDFVFICVTERYGGFRFVRFEAQTGGQPKISVFGWDRRQSGGVRPLLEINLPALKMPPMNVPGEPDWSRAHWGEAWIVEKITREFCREYRTTFEAVEGMIATANAAVDQDWRSFTQRLFNRLMFIQFLSRLRGDAPFLNGSLFEMAIDGSDEPGATQIPDAVFDRIVHGLFARWNFTLAENTPLDVEVAVDPEMLGKVFEKLVTGRHASGSYYTPRTIVAFMCREALKHYLTAAGIPAETAAAFVDDRNTSCFREEEIETTFVALKQVRVVDPACGSGAYLLGMLHELMELRKLLFNPNRLDDPRDDYGRKLDIIRHNLYGVDLDESAVNIARLRLWLSLAVENEGAGSEPLSNLDFKIERGDSLMTPSLHTADNGTTDLRTAQGGFDIVVTNPPYLSTKHGFGQKNRTLLMQRYQVARGQFDAYTLFLEHALSLLCDTGCYAYIVPKPILTNRNMSPVRKLLNIEKVIAIADPGTVFEASVEPIILVGQKQGRAGNVIKICTEGYFRDEKEGCRCASPADVCTPAGIWNIATPTPAGRWIARVADLPGLGDLFDIKRGIECGKKDAAIRQSARHDAYPLLRGEDLDRFAVCFANRYIVRGQNERVFKPQQLYDAPKLIIRRVANQLIAAIDLQGYHVLNTIYVVRARQATALSLEYICALLNSGVMNDYFRAVFVNDDKLFPYVRKEQLDQLPIAMPTTQDEAMIISLVRQIPGATPEQSTRIQNEIESIIQQIFATHNA